MFYRPGIDNHGLPHNPLKALIAPRPIAWVSTLSPGGVPNLAPFSFFNGVSEAPPIVMLAAYGFKAGTKDLKDTPSNILASGEFVVHSVPYALRDEMNASAAPYPAGVDEFEAVGLEKAPCELIAAPRIKAAPMALECRYLTRTVLPSTDPAYENAVIFGEVVGIHIDEAVLRDGMVDVTLYRPLARLGYMDYASTDAVFQMPRPMAVPDKSPS
ncbi:MAG: flavin reductase family protein [Neomegalonema sp.]|nr:flavin reductase family protein [Neomegalonema sp.]